MRKPDIGLVLSGGGARGAYQLGVMAALEKYRLYDSVKAVSGGSIGTFSSMLFLIRDLRSCYRIWKDMDAERVLGYKDSFTSKIPIKDRGLFSRAALLSYIYRNFDLAELLRINIPVYSCCTRVEKKGLRKTYRAEYFLLNYKPQDYIAQVLLATSAIPFIFDAVPIGDGIYVDCLKSDNEPSKPLEQYVLDYLFVVPLTSAHNPAKYSHSETPVVDFLAPELSRAPLMNMLEFDPAKTDYYLNLGYYVGAVILSYLREHGAFRSERRRSVPSYVSLETIGVTLKPHKLLTIDEIIADIKKGPKL